MPTGRTLLRRTSYIVALLVACQILLGTTCVSSARRAYSSYGNLDEKEIDEILHGKKKSYKKPARTRLPSSRTAPLDIPNSNTGSISVNSATKKTLKPSQALAAINSRRKLAAKLSPCPRVSPPTSLDWKEGGR